MTKLIVYVDGGSRGNPGPAAIGVVICLPANRLTAQGVRQAGNADEEVLKKYLEYLGDKITNNEAEYQALIFAFKKIKALFGKKKIKEMELEIKSDSELLIKQLNGLYKILDPKIQKLFLKAWNAKIDFKEVKFKLVSRKANLEADRLVNEVLDSQGKQGAIF